MMTTSDPRKYSEQLGVITDEQLQQACDVFDLGTVKAAEPASAGLWGQNILLTTTTGAFVLRGNPQTPQQFAKERVVAAAINERSSLPVPWPYHLNMDADILGWAYAVMPLLPGTMGSTLWERADDQGKIVMAQAHGAALARLHEAAFEAPGPYDPDRGAFVAVTDYREWTVNRIESLRGQCRTIDALSTEDDRYIDTIIRECVEALSEPLVPVLVHHDFSLANTNYEVSHMRYRATGVFDLGEAHVGDGEEDLVRFIFRRKREQRAAFVNAYAGRRPFRAGAGERLALYALADFLFMWQVSRSVTNWFGEASFIDTATRIIENARTAPG
jgi:aminoglycoside phosphotransferase (APT) family kinase protein